MLDFLLDQISDSPSTYLVLFGIIFVDDFVPFAPGDTAMITAGILAANGGLSIYLVILAGAVGGMLGDNLFYWLGRRYGPGLADRLLRGDRGQVLYRSARQQISDRSATIIIVGRFIPGGRTVTTFACGTARLAYPAIPASRLAGGCGLGDLHRFTRVHRRPAVSRCPMAAVADWARPGIRAGRRSGGTETKARSSRPADSFSAAQLLIAVTQRIVGRIRRV